MPGYLESLINYMGIQKKALRVGNICVVLPPSLQKREDKRGPSAKISERKLLTFGFLSSQNHRVRFHSVSLSYSCYHSDHKETHPFSLKVRILQSQLLRGDWITACSNTEHSGEQGAEGLMEK